MSRAARFAASLTFATLGVTSGCSFVFVTGPDKTAPGRFEAGDCTSSRVVPVVDAVITTLQLLQTIYVFSQSDADFRRAPISRDTAITLGVSMSLLFGVSAIYGFTTADSCRELRGGQVNPYLRPEVRRKADRQAEEADEEAAVEARQRAQAAEEKAAPPPVPGPAAPTVEIPDAGPPAAP